MKINICIIKPLLEQHPSFFEDSAFSLLDILKDLGYDCVITFNIIDPSFLNIVFGVGAFNTVPITYFRELTNKNNTIIFNMEQLSGGGAMITKDYLDLLSDYVFFDYNCENINFMSSLGLMKNPAFEFPLAPTLRFSFIEDYKFDFSSRDKNNIAFYGSINNKRSAVLQRLLRKNISIDFISSSFGKSLTEHIINSRSVINIHYYNSRIFEVARVLRPVAFGIPVISEKSFMPSSVNWNDSGVYFVDFESNNFEDEVFSVLNNLDYMMFLSRKSLNFIHEKNWMHVAENLMKNVMNLFD